MVMAVLTSGPTSHGGKSQANSGCRRSAKTGSPKRPKARPASVMPTWTPAM